MIRTSWPVFNFLGDSAYIKRRVYRRSSSYVSLSMLSLPADFIPNIVAGQAVACLRSSFRTKARGSAPRAHYMQAHPKGLSLYLGDGGLPSFAHFYSTFVIMWHMCNNWKACLFSSGVYAVYKNYGNSPIRRVQSMSLTRSRKWYLSQSCFPNPSRTF